MSVTIKCLSLWQPWATLMAIGAKRIETRSSHITKPTAGLGTTPRPRGRSSVDAIGGGGQHTPANPLAQGNRRASTALDEALFGGRQTNHNRL